MQSADDVLADDPKTQQQRMKSLRLLQDRCGDFVADDFDAWGSTGTGSSEDILLAAERDFIAASTKKGATLAQRNRALARIIELGDPLLFDKLGHSLTLHRAPGGGAAAYFAGQSYSLSRDTVAYTAIYLVPCLLGLRCDIDAAPMLAVECATGGVCHPDRFSRAREEFTGGNASAYSSALQLANAMADAIRRGDAAAFIKPE
jgi:hypothetical protein